MLFALFFYAVLMALWATIVAAHRRIENLIGLATLAALLPITVVALELFGVVYRAGLVDPHLVDVSPTPLLTLLYFVLSMWMVIRAYTAPVHGTKAKPRGFPIEPTKSAAPPDSESV